MTNIAETLSSEALERKNFTELIVDRIRSLVVDGRLKPGDQLPSEVDLASILKVSRNTLREALNLLQQEGAIIRKQGVGTFVTTGPLLQNRLDINHGVTELIRSMGRTPGLREINVSVTQADEYWAGLLDCPVGTELIRIRRVRTADGKPVVASLAMVQRETLRQVEPRFSEAQLAESLREKHSLLIVLQEYFGLVVDYGIARLRPLQADADTAKKLEIKEGSVLIRLEQVDYDARGEPLIASHEDHVAEVSNFTIYRKR